MADDNLIIECDNLGERIDLDTYRSGLVHELTGTEAVLRPHFSVGCRTAKNYKLKAGGMGEKSTMNKLCSMHRT